MNNFVQGLALVIEESFQLLGPLIFFLKEGQELSHVYPILFRVI